MRWGIFYLKKKSTWCFKQVKKEEEALGPYYSG
jgi:hypothetical protein